MLNLSLDKDFKKYFSSKFCILLEMLIAISHLYFYFTLMIILSRSNVTTSSCILYNYKTDFEVVLPELIYTYAQMRSAFQSKLP